MWVFRSFLPNQKCLSLHMFFETGEHARKAMEPKEDQVRMIERKIFYSIDD